MKEIMAIIIGLALVGWMVWVQYPRKELPPKAKLICDVWKVVEGSEIHNQDTARV